MPSSLPKPPNGLEAAIYAAIMKEARRTGQAMRLPGPGNPWYVPGIGKVGDNDLGARLVEEFDKRRVDP